jgi:ATP-dependent Clp protease protease subunit
MVIESGPRGERAFDIFSLLLRNRVIFLGTPINDQVANLTVAQLLYLNQEDPEAPISMYINSPGGQIYAGLAIYDTMQYIRPSVATICIGMSASIAALLLAGGTKGKRTALPNSRIMIHQPWGGTQGTASDIHIQAEEILKIKKQINGILAGHTGKTTDRIEADTDRDRYMSADEAREYGIIDNILVKKPKIEPKK